MKNGMRKCEFDAIMRGAKAVPACDYPTADQLQHQVCEVMSHKQLVDFAKVLIEKGVASYNWGDIVLKNGYVVLKNGEYEKF